MQEPLEDVALLFYHIPHPTFMEMPGKEASKLLQVLHSHGAGPSTAAYNQRGWAGPQFSLWHMLLPPCDPGPTGRVHSWHQG